MKIICEDVKGVYKDWFFFFFLVVALGEIIDGIVFLVGKGLWRFWGERELKRRTMMIMRRRRRRSNDC
jgi:hypothetical protein